jgi:putative ABC transport system substrate-binding protein
VSKALRRTGYDSGAACAVAGRTYPMTTRRQALRQLALIASTSGLPAASGAAASKLVGILSEANASKEGLEWEPKLWRAMAERGWILGKNVAVERAFANAKLELLPQLAEELVRKRVDVICVADDQDAMVAAARATRTIPIVVFDAFDPVEQGLIESFARPGRNVTGVALTAGADLAVKRLQYLRAIAPAAKRLAWITSSETLFRPRVDGTRIDVAASIAAAAQLIGFQTRFFHAPSASDIDKAFADAVTWGAQAVSERGWPMGSSAREVAQLALRHRLPSAFLASECVEAGGLLSYAVPDSEYELAGLRCIEYVDRVLRGAKPADLPFMGPDRFELTVNTKTAETLGLTIPQSILVRADKLFR